MGTQDNLYVYDLAYMFYLAVQAPNNLTSRIKLHTEEVCGLIWPSRGNTLASGGNVLPLEEAQKMVVLRYGIHKRGPVLTAWIPKLRPVIEFAPVLISFP